MCVRPVYFFWFMLHRTKILCLARCIIRLFVKLLYARHHESYVCVWHFSRSLWAYNVCFRYLVDRNIWSHLLDQHKYRVRMVMIRIHSGCVGTKDPYIRVYIHTYGTTTKKDMWTLWHTIHRKITNLPEMSWIANTWATIHALRRVAWIRFKLTIFSGIACKSVIMLNWIMDVYQQEN